MLISQNTTHILAPHQTPKHNGTPVGTMRRHELYKLCMSLKLPVDQNMTGPELVAVYSMHDTVQQYQAKLKQEKRK